MSDKEQVPTLQGLISKLYNAIDGVLDGTVEVHRANSAKGLADSVCGLAKLEYQFRDTFNVEAGTGFFPEDQDALEQPAVKQLGGTNPRLRLLASKGVR